MSDIEKMSGIIEEAIGEDEIKQASLRDLYYVLFRHKWKIIIFFFAVIITVTIGTFLADEVYRSEATLLVRLGPGSAGFGSAATAGQTNSELEILGSRDLMEKVVDSIGVNKFLKRSDEKLSANTAVSETPRKPSQQFPVEVKKQGNILERLDVDSLGDHDRVVAEVEEKLESDHDKAVAGQKLEGGLDRSSLKAKKKLVRDRGIAVGMIMDNLEIGVEKDSSTISVSFDAYSPSLAQNVLSTIVDLYLEKHISVYRTPGSYEFFNQQASQLRDALTQSEEKLWGLKNETGIASVKTQRQIFLNRMGALEQEIKTTEAELSSSTGRLKELQKTLQPTLLAERADFSSLKAKADTLKNQLLDAQTELRALNENEVRIIRLEREISIQEANYRKYSESLEQARIDHAMEADKISNISVVQPATYSMSPVRPRKSRNLALGFLLGLFGAIGFAFFSEYMDHSIRTPEDVAERLQLPSFVSIPDVGAKRIFPISKRPQDKNAGRIWNTPSVRQYYETIRERLLFSNDSMAAPCVLAVMGCQRDEGASTVAANLATTLSQHGDANVLLIDADILHPSVHQAFKTKLSPGLTDIMADLSNGGTIQSLPGQNLHILSAGAADGNLSEVFDSDGFTRLLTSAKHSYRFIVVDVPALGDASSSVRLASLCDGVVLVIESGQLRREVVQNAREQLLKSKANVLGVVLNKRQYHVPQWLYKTL